MLTATGLTSKNAQVAGKPADAWGMTSANPLGLVPVNRYDRQAIIGQIAAAHLAGRRVAVAYLRISDDFKDTRESITLQYSDVDYVAKDLDVDVLVIFEDNDLSGAKERDDDSEFGSLLAFLREFSVDYVIGYAIERLGRNFTDTEKLEKLYRERGLIVWTKADRNVFADDLWPVRAGFAKAEVTRMRGRLMRSQARRKANGQDTGGGARPYGYAADRMTVLPAEARVIRFIARAILRGVPGVQIARYLNGEGRHGGRVPTTVSGRWLAATVRAIGMRPDLTNATEVTIAHRMNAQGQSAKSIARQLNRTCAEIPDTDLCGSCAAGRTDDCERRTATTRPSLWSSFMVRSIVARPRVAGFREDGAELVPAAWPAILDEETWLAVRRALAETSGTTGDKRAPGPPVQTLLAGLLYCGLCMSPMVGAHQGDGRLTYRCPGATQDGRRIPGKHVGRSRALLDSFVTDLMLTELDEGEVQTELDELNDRLDDVETRITAIQIPMHEAEVEFRARRLPAPQYAAALAQWRGELRTLNNERNAVLRVIAEATELRSARARWDGWSNRERRTAIRSRYAMIILNPANRFGHQARTVIPSDVEIIPAETFRERIAAKVAEAA